MACFSISPESLPRGYILKEDAMFISCKAWLGEKKKCNPHHLRRIFLMQIKLLVEGQESRGLSRLGKFSCSYNDHLLWKLT